MTVKCLSQMAKNSIVNSYVHHGMGVKDLSVFWVVSRRTIIRVLEESNIDPVKHRVKKAEINDFLDVPVLGLDQLVIPMQPGTITHFDAQTTSLDDDLPQKSWVKRFFRSLRDAMAIY